MYLIYVSERLKNHNVEQTKLEPTNCLDEIKYEFLLLWNKTLDNLDQIHAIFIDQFLSWFMVANSSSQRLGHIIKKVI